MSKISKCVRSLPDTDGCIEIAQRVDVKNTTVQRTCIVNEAEVSLSLLCPEESDYFLDMRKQSSFVFDETRKNLSRPV